MKKTWIILAALLTLPLSYNACRMDGTGTGNPMSNKYSSSQGQAVIGDAAFGASGLSEPLMHRACTRVMACHSGVTFDACVSGMKSAAGGDRKLGITSNRYPTYADIMKGERQGAFMAMYQANVDCNARLANLACSSRELQDAYLKSEPQPFAKITDIFDPACRGVFLEK